MKIVLLIFLMMTTFVDAFTNLSELQRYAVRHEEYPDADSNNWSEPSFINFRKSIEPTFLDSLVRKFGFGKPLLWSSQEFVEALQKAVIGLDKTQEGKVLVGMAIDTDTRFIIWSDLHGSFHSLVRSLVDLREQHIIDDNLHILPAATYLVFNGNVLEGSPYILETATVVFLLKERNPGKVFYLKGEEEDKHRWQEQDLGRQLQFCCGSLGSSSLGNNINTYFKGLIYAIYVTDAEKKYIVRIASHVDLLKELFESSLAKFFESLLPGKFTNYSFFESKWVKTSRRLNVIIEGRADWGLAPARPVMHEKLTNGTIVWQLLSAQNRSYRQLRQFFYDSYALVNFKKIFERSTLAIRFRDVRKQEAFHEICYNLFTAEACDKDSAQFSIDIRHVERNRLDPRKGGRKLGN
jgi:hypothetical protein